MTLELEAQLEALLFLSADPVDADALAEATGFELHEVVTALERLREHLDFERRGLVLRRLAGGWALSSHPDAEPAARKLLARPRTPPLTPAQAETVAIIAYLQPVSRPEIARIRGVNAESATGTLLERGMIEECGRSPFGAVLYRTSELFLRLFGLESLDVLPSIAEFDPSPELEEELRHRLLRAGEARSGTPLATAAGYRDHAENGSAER
jgi:segregation and condensation protein B